VKRRPKTVTRVGGRKAGQAPADLSAEVLAQVRAVLSESGDGKLYTSQDVAEAVGSAVAAERYAIADWLKKRGSRK